VVRIHQARIAAKPTATIAPNGTRRRRRSARLISSSRRPSAP